MSHKNNRICHDTDEPLPVGSNVVNLGIIWSDIVECSETFLVRPPKRLRETGGNPREVKIIGVRGIFFHLKIGHARQVVVQEGRHSTQVLTVLVLYFQTKIYTCS